MLAVQSITKAFGTKIVADAIDFHFPDKLRIALIGANGCGKSTFLKILAGEESPDDGVVVKSQDLKLGYLSQHANPNPKNTIIEEATSGRRDLLQLRERILELENQLNSDPENTSVIHKLTSAQDQFRTLGGFEVEAEAARILAGLGFTTERMKGSPRDLSGGWRMRVELAKILVQKPDVLMLDEPTNHLDLPSLMWFENYLLSFVGTVIFVSHDRALLNRLSQLTILLNRGRFEAYTGNFDDFLKQRQARLLERQAQRDNLRDKRLELERFVERFGAKATKAAQAQSKQKSIDKILEEEESLADEADQSTIKIRFPSVEKSSRLVLKSKELKIGYNAHPLPCRFDFEIERGQRIAIIGANGLGKSTLLKTITGEIPPCHGELQVGNPVKLGYYAQEQTASINTSKTVLQNVLDKTPLGDKDARDLLGSLLFRGDDVFKNAGVLSGGEKSRLALAMVLGQKCNLLLLDEPTNHLDIASAETLAEALKSFEGTLIFVSHDRDFINQVATHCLALAPDGRSLMSIGNLSDFPRSAASADFPNILNSSPAPTTETTRHNSSLKTDDSTQASSHEDFKRLKSLRQKLTGEITQLDRNMQTQKAEIDRLEQELHKIDFSDYQKSQQLNQKLEEVRESLSMAEERWLQASEELESTVQTLQRMGRL
jgi:ATP-binding cassette subfamily F protein 3